MPEFSVNEDVIRAKLDSLGRCLERIREKCPVEARALEGDFDRQDVLAVNLERAVQLCVDMASHFISGSNHPPPHTMGDAFDALAELKIIDADLADSLRRAVGFRNLSVHAYDKLDWDIVHRAAIEGVKDLALFGRSLERLFTQDKL